MADHQAEPQDESKPDDAVSEGQNPAASTDDVSALKSEMIKHRQEVARLKEENEKLMASSENQDPTPPQASQGDKYVERLDAIERRDQMRELMHEHDLNPRQADSVVDLMKTMPGLDAGEAKLLAAQRDKELFSEEAASSGFDQSVHGTSRPTSGSQLVEQSEGPDTEDRLKYINSIRGNKREYNKYLNNLTGSVAAKQVNKPGHKRHPIPNKQ